MMEMCWLYGRRSLLGDVVNQLQEMWWLNCRGCGGSIAGDVVTQLQGMWWLSGRSKGWLNMAGDVLAYWTEI